MTPESNDGRLRDVYAARSATEIATLYDNWAGEYESDMAKAGYRHPAITTALLTRHLPRGAAPLLDAGAGTGLAGEWLAILGYPHVEGLDISAGMLAKARNKAVYKALHCCGLGGELPFSGNSFAGVVSAGVFTTGHVGEEALPELIRITKPGGVIVLTVKGSRWQASFGAAVRAASEQLQLVETTEPYVSMPGEHGTSPGVAIVLRKL